MFTKLKAKDTGLRVRVDLSKVSLIEELPEGKGTALGFDNGNALVVEESFQTVSNRAAGEKPEAVSGETLHVQV